ncbi:Cell death protease [Exophiala xenobiotica]|uniref:Carboxypeptidase n=1 Tax=Lithohypha guttulata TaxID=1690604 RepID=A0ABR0KN33_9EURO|nr:Cell death protease [Lithohypha guttulata]KAK5328921.1 Cell death protease [Exophiala xenobiotica]
MAPNLDRRKSRVPGLSLIWLLALFIWALPAAWAEKTAADYYVKSMPGAPKGPLLKMHAGHVEVNHEHNGNLFFWHFANRHIANRPRTVIWLNGGPGCSSEDGALMEIGPYRVREGGKLEYNDGSWDEFANLLFVDNPVGTGFSYVNTDSYLHELQEMADQFITFLEKWFALFPDYANDDLYIAGESYAGQHIPYISRAIMDRNNKSGSEDKWNLKGILIGNGWISPAHQYQAYVSFAYAEGLVQGGTDDGNRLDRALTDCNNELAKPGAADRININVCENVLSEFLEVTRSGGQCYNMYDVRLRDTYPACGMNWPPDLNQVTNYLRQKDVTDALHINSDKRTGWSECSGSVSSNFRAQKSKASITLIPQLLNDDLPILLFSGAKDMICNHLGTEDLISTMKWGDGTGMETSAGVYAPKRDWYFEGEAAGIWQEARNLTYVLFYNSSHMVPFDYPRRTRDMLDRFMGVDIASIGGKPVDSQIDGEKAHSETSVGGHPNSTVAQEESKDKLHQAELNAYYKSGEAALLVVILIAVAFGFWVWRGRRRQRKTQENDLGAYAPVNGKHRDVEAQDFDERELQNLSNGSGKKRFEDPDDMHGERYDIGSDSDDDDDDQASGRGKEAGA